MKRMIFSILIALVAAPAQAATPQTAEQFVRSLYVDLARGDLGEPLWRRSLSNSLRQLEHRYGSVVSTETAASGAHAADPVCACQDPIGMRIVSLKVTSDKDGTIATVRVRYSWGETGMVKLMLVNEHGWKLADIFDKNEYATGGWTRYTNDLYDDIRHPR